ncbi:hypothetical protein BG74_00290 [Sodalis-like endosymbiont of Proechinophthirus fluctus]|nr:hypothetical protein BG74_00290 [Sodalis-like endosymbiont of Proechinophthirus fluctus]
MSAAIISMETEILIAFYSSGRCMCTGQIESGKWGEVRATPGGGIYTDAVLLLLQATASAKGSTPFPLELNE